MAQTGVLNQLTVVKQVPFGVYLDAGELGEVLLPSKFVPSDCEPGSQVEVFLYTDSEDMIIATTVKPKAMVGEFAYLPVIDVSRHGAFMDWGLDKDLLVPFNQQRVPMESGRNYVVHIYRDQHSERIAASAKLDRFLDKKTPRFARGDKVSVLIAQRTDLGYKAVVNNAFWGVIYNNEVFKPIRVGQKHTAYIKQVREDGRIDISLQPGQQAQMDDVSQAILNHLEAHDGVSSLNDKSDPAVISKVFGVSKGVFKRAIGGLFKAGLIEISKQGIRLVQDNAESDFD
ncbi:CvfB family protein [Motilimonas pumila]|uniref:GntR family transcriptional regulator n=1 Tax=Motilimonas pumila TaxID=2303987 RepID=A0A418YFN6_9GAMM|nr:S1-like domain-containing RNA-binding protein [Motilimonas pumila]RJG48192.1 GntR family transcriptional regulator [Motilimonas pumila]